MLTEKMVQKSKNIARRPPWDFKDFSSTFFIQSVQMNLDLDTSNTG